MEGEMSVDILIQVTNFIKIGPLVLAVEHCTADKQ